MLNSADVNGMESQNEASHNEYKEKQAQLAKDAAEMSRKGAELEIVRSIERYWQGVRARTL